MEILKTAFAILLFAYLIKLGVFLIRRAMAKWERKKRPQGYVTQTEALWLDKPYANNAKTLHALADPIAPVLEFWNDPSAEEFSCFVGDSLNARVKHSKQTLRKNGIRRRLLVSPYFIAQSAKGRSVRKWDDGGREWQACDLVAAVLEEYFDAAGALIASYYYSAIDITPLISRRLGASEKAETNKRDKWGRKMKPRSFYADQKITTCPSCGGALPEDVKDPVCPFCGSTMFSDYYDWQIEGIEFTPHEVVLRTFTDSLIELFASEKIGCRIAFRHKCKKDKRVVRFSENAFYYDVYDSCIEAADPTSLVDLWLGKIEIVKVRHTETDTYLNIRVPVWSTIISNGKVIKTKKIKKATFVRTRYPNKFDKANAVVAKEKQCPSCGGEYAVDPHGKCIHCGTFLFLDNSHWREKSAIPS